MKTEVKKIDSTKREISIEASGDIIRNKFEDVFKKIGQEAKVPGFRLGHVPRDILEKKFSSVAHEYVVKDLIPDLYRKAIEQESLDVIDMPNISDVKLDRNTLSFRAEVEIHPQIALKNYRGIKLNYKKLEVGQDDIKRTIDSLRESRKIDSADDGFARSLGYPDISALEKSIQMQLILQKENQQHKSLENELIESLTKDLDFKIPQALVERQLQEMVRQASFDMALKGIPKEKIEEQGKKLNQDLAPEAKRQVKIYLVFSEIAKKENIPHDDHMAQNVIEFLFREADWIVSNE